MARRYTVKDFQSDLNSDIPDFFPRYVLSIAACRLHLGFLACDLVGLFRDFAECRDWIRTFTQEKLDEEDAAHKKNLTEINLCEKNPAT